MSRKLNWVVASVVGAAALAAASVLIVRAAENPPATPSPPPCAPVNPVVADSVQFMDKQCRVTVYGPTTERCQMYMLQGVPVLDCPGVALQKFTMAAWP